MGIQEPVSGDSLEAKAFFEKYKKEDILVIVPLLAFDKKGHRVGYGKGFYDKFLEHKTTDTTTVGLSFFEAEDPFVDTQSHDISLDFVVTPSRIYQW
jgi:5-formyltetrahydrofolate cyclo-ligase